LTRKLPEEKIFLINKNGNFNKYAGIDTLKNLKEYTFKVNKKVFFR